MRLTQCFTKLEAGTGALNFKQHGRCEVQIFLFCFVNQNITVIRNGSNELEMLKLRSCVPMTLSTF